ncbi:MAG: hypothetical protein ACTFAK_04780 [Candidatus Electronema sp. VV]
MNHPYIFGIDVSKAKLDIALLLPDGKFRSEVISRLSFPRRKAIP